MGRAFSIVVSGTGGEEIDHAIAYPEKFTSMVRTALAHLSLPADEQIRYLVDQRVGADELALELNDVVDLLSELVQRGYVSRAAADLITAIDARFDAMSGSEHAHRWTDQALAQSAEWEEIRSLARAAVREMADFG